MLNVREMKSLLLPLTFFVAGVSTLLANGGAWQSGVPGTGTASASNKSQKTDVTIENETLKIDLHPDYADVTVHYRTHNTGAKVQQDFFFPVERWGENPDSDNQGKGDDIDHYQISVDGKELKWTNVAGPKEESSETKEDTSQANQESSEYKEFVVGSHPHCVQQLDFYHGCPIAYSLGNLVFDGAPTIDSWNHGALLEIGLDENAQASSISLIPLVLEDGLPRMDAGAGNSLSSR